MSAPMETSSDSSMDEDEAKRLNEASVDGTVHDLKKNFRGNKSHISDNRRNRNGCSSGRPSLRNDLETKPGYCDGNVSTTPQVREFIAKKLSTVLDQSIELQKDINGKPVDNEEDNGNEGFQMFSSNTQKQLDKLKEAKRQKIEEMQKKRQQKNESSSDSSEEESRLVEAAVSAEFIWKHSGLNTVSKGTGENTVTKETDVNSHPDTINSRSNPSAEETVKHKKKKRKSHDDEIVTGTNPESISNMCSVKKKKKSKHKDIESFQTS